MCLLANKFKAGARIKAWNWLIQTIDNLIKLNYNINMKYIAKNLDDTRKIADEFAGKIKAGDTVLLSGDLGAGKTTFTQFVFKKLGVKGVVNSPTFAVLKTYSGDGVELNHFDCYRINTAEAIECGFDEVLSAERCINFVEWSQNIAELLPQNCIRVDINFVGENREFNIEGV